MVTKRQPPIALFPFSIILAALAIAGVWHIGESLNDERQQAFVQTQGERITRYMAEQHSRSEPSVIIFGNSFLRNALPEEYPEKPSAWLRIVYFDPLYFIALYPILESNPPDVLIIQDDLLLPLRFGDGQSPTRRLQRHMREIRPLLEKYIKGRAQRMQQLEKQMQATQDAFVPCIKTEEQKAIRNMQRKARAFYQRFSASPEAIDATRTLATRIPKTVLLRIPMAPVIEQSFGKDMDAWHQHIRQRLSSSKPVLSLTLSEPQAPRCYCDYAHIERSCREPLIQAMTQFITRLQEPS